MGKTNDKSEPPFEPPRRPLLIILSGPSGVGKDAVLNKLKESGYPLTFITTLTTRTQRSNEQDNVDYHFVLTEKFQKMLENGELLESAKVYDNWYGVPKKTVRQALDRREDTIIKIDVQGATTIKTIVPQAVFIFLMPPSLEDLTTRLKQRYTESPSALTLRLKTAEEELKELSLFDYVVVNNWGEIDQAVSEIEAIISAEKRRLTPREIALS